MDIRQIINFQGNYSQINREERNLSAIFFLALCKSNNIERFLDYFGYQKQVGPDFGIYFEYAFLRDLWKHVEINQMKKEIIRQHLRISSIEKVLNQPIVEINKTFGVAGSPSTKYLQNPGRWSIRKYSDQFQNNNDFLKICRFKWSFNIKPDIVIHLSKNQALCIEAKYESGEGSYPGSSIDKKIFNERGLPYVGQMELQKYMMEDLLGITTNFMLLVNKPEHSTTHRIVSWGEMFSCLDLSDVPNFAREMINRVNTLR